MCVFKLRVNSSLTISVLIKPRIFIQKTDEISTRPTTKWAPNPLHTQATPAINTTIFIQF